MKQLGRPSAIFEMIHEARCADCGAWIRVPILRFHRETEHPKRPTQEGGEIREIPLPLRIAEYVEAGNYLSDAAAACGVDRRTVTRWMEWGGAIDGEFGPEADPDEIPAGRRLYWLFRLAVDRGREAARAHRVRRIAASDDWKAQAWLLERTSPAEFGRVDRLRVGGDPDAGPVRVVHEEVDPDFIRDVMRIYEEQGVLPGVDSGHNGTGHNGKRRPKKEV